MFTLIDLPYKSLAPVVSDQTLSFHHGKHLQAYVDNLNKLIAGTAFEGKSLEEIIVLSSGAKAGAEKVPAVFNNAGQILNHALYFLQFAPGGSTPAGSLAAQIEKQWGSLEAFQAAFAKPKASAFSAAVGSGSRPMPQGSCPSPNTLAPTTPSPTGSSPSSPSTSGSTPTTWITRTAVPRICTSCGRWWIGV